MKQSKVAWITGGGTGIGAELTKILVSNGWKVAVSGRRVDKLKGIEAFNPFEVPLVNTLILLCSGATITYSHHAITAGDKKGAV